jgi:FkbM family methyltransferase
VFDSLIVRYVRAPEHPAKLRLVHALGRMMVPECGVVAPVASDLELYLHPRDWIEYLLLRGDAYEPLTLAFMQANLRPGDTAVLAGINFGLHVARAARSVGDAGVVIGVDPQPGALLRTRLNLALNGLLSSVKLIQAALGETEQLTFMPWSDPQNAGAASLLDQGPGFHVQVMRLDSLLEALGRPHVRLLLLDVQGYERDALAGANLAEGPEIGVIELDPEFLERSGVAADEIAQMLLAAGYSLFDVHGNRQLNLLNLPERNLVAVRRGASVQWVSPHGAGSADASAPPGA